MVHIKCWHCFKNVGREDLNLELKGHIVGVIRNDMKPRFRIFWYFKTPKTIDVDRTPEALALKFIEAMKETGMTPNEAYIVHWPLDNYGGQLKNNRSSQIVDDLLTGKRNGSF